jgi:hypothetical protein
VVAVRLTPAELDILDRLVQQGHPQATPTSVIRALLQAAGFPVNETPGAPKSNPVNETPGAPKSNPVNETLTEADLAAIFDDTVLEVGARVVPTEGLYAGAKGRVVKLAQGKATVEFRTAQGQSLTCTFEQGHLKPLEVIP